MGKWETDFLFAKPSLASGVASALDLMGVFPSYNISKTPEEADAKALLNDWYNVGNDLAEAIPAYVKKS